MNEIVAYIILLSSLILSNWIYVEERIKAPGIIAAPLVAIYALNFGTIVLLALFIVALTVHFSASMVYKKTFIYGRRLFFFMCAVSVIVSIPLLGFFLPNIEGMGFWTSVVPALFVYNIHTNGASKTSSTIIRPVAN